jgi:ribosomal protein L32E
MDLREKLFAFGNYPEKDIEEMIGSGYSPIMIGNLHDFSYMDEERKNIVRCAKNIGKNKFKELQKYLNKKIK